MNCEYMCAHANDPAIRRRGSCPAIEGSTQVEAHDLCAAIVSQDALGSNNIARQPDPELAELPEESNVIFLPDFLLRRLESAQAAQSLRRSSVLGYEDYAHFVTNNNPSSLNRNLAKE